LLDSSLPEEEELDPLVLDPLDDSVLVDGVVVVVVEDSVPVEEPDDSVLVDGVVAVDDAVPFEEPEDPVLFDVPLDVEAAVVVAFLVESAGSCPEASWT
jgi:hypothetical protein